MLKKIHKQYHKNEITLRDYLAAHRTVLANDRTWLAYLRTALTFSIAGITFIKFFNNKTLFIIGWIFIPFSIIFLVIGIKKYIKVRHLINDIKDNS